MDFANKCTVNPCIHPMILTNCTIWCLHGQHPGGQTMPRCSFVCGHKRTCAGLHCSFSGSLGCSIWWMFVGILVQIQNSSYYFFARVSIVIINNHEYGHICSGQSRGDTGLVDNIQENKLREWSVFLYIMQGALPQHHRKPVVQISPRRNSKASKRRRLAFQESLCWDSLETVHTDLFKQIDPL